MSRSTSRRCSGFGLTGPSQDGMAMRFIASSAPISRNMRSPYSG
jgi:hypothetical protein